MLICRVDSVNKKAIININNCDNELHFNEINYINEITNDDIIINCLKLIKRLSIDLKVKFNAKNIDTTILIDNNDVFNLICLNGKPIDKLSKSMKKSIINNDIKLNLGGVISELNGIQNLNFNIMKGDDYMFTTKENYKAGSMLSSLKPENNSIQSISNTNNHTIIKSNNKNEVPNNLSNKNKDDYFDDFELDFGEEEIKTNEVNHDSSSLKKDDNISSNDNVQSLDLIDDFELDFGDEESKSINKNNPPSISEDITNISLDFEDSNTPSIELDKKDSDLLENNDLNTTDSNDTFDIDFENTSSENTNLDNSNEEDFKDAIDKESVLELLEESNSVSDGVVKESNNSDISISKQVDTKTTDVTVKENILDEFSFISEYIDNKLSELNKDISSLKESSKQINLNIGDLDIDENIILEKFNQTMEIRSKIKSIESYCKVYKNLKEELNKNLNTL